MLRTYFTITISGSGKDVDECWNDAVFSLYDEPGPTPEEGEYEISEDEDDEEETDEDEE